MARWARVDTAKMVAECGYGGIDYTVRKAQAHVLPTKVREDLPRMMRELAHLYPLVQFECDAAVGENKALLDLMARIAARD